MSTFASDNNDNHNDTDENKVSVQSLPLECQFRHRAFLTQVKEMSPEQMRLMLENLHSYVLNMEHANRTWIKEKLAG